MIEVRSVTTCPCCGFTEEDFRRTLQLGCPECYRTFQFEIERMLPQMHHGTTHCGKIPMSTRDPARLLHRELKEVESLLKAHAGQNSAVDELLDRWNQLHKTLSKLACASPEAPSIL
jgi:protein-arginine kinase activator protein McsA